MRLFILLAFASLSLAQSITPSGAAAGCVIHNTPVYVCRAGQDITLTAAGGAPYSWSTLEGSINVRGSGAVVVVTPKVFGQYQWQVSTGSGTATITIGAVPTTDNGSVIQPTATRRVVFGSLLRWGLSPWPDVDSVQRNMADHYYGLMSATYGANIYAENWQVPQAGMTVSATNNSGTYTFSGGDIQALVCGAGQTTLPGGGDGVTIVLWINATTRQYMLVSGCPNTTTITGQSWVLPTQSNMQFSILSAVGYQFLGSSGFNKRLNFYDGALAAYSLYYRTGLTRHRTTARLFAERWFRSGFQRNGLNPGTSVGGYSRDHAFAGLAVWGDDVGGSIRDEIWNNYATNLFPFEDLFFTSGVGQYFAYSEGYTDFREEGNRLHRFALRACCDPDATRKTAAKAKLDAYLLWMEAHRIPTHYMRKRIGGDDAVYVTDVVVTNGSAVVTTTGTYSYQGQTGSGFHTVTCAGYGTEPASSLAEWGVTFYIDENNGDSNAYACTRQSSSQITLTTPYTGTSGTKKLWANVVAGINNHQPYFLMYHGAQAAMAAAAYDELGDTVRAAQMRVYTVAAADWVRTRAYDVATGGVPYAAGGGNCPLASSCSLRFSLADDQFFALEGASALGDAHIIAGGTLHRDLLDVFIGRNFGAGGGTNGDGANFTYFTYPYTAGGETVPQGRFFNFPFGAGGIASALGARAGGAGAPVSSSVSVHIGDSGTRNITIVAPSGAVTTQSCATSCASSVDVRAGSATIY